MKYSFQNDRKYWLTCAEKVWEKKRQKLTFSQPKFSKVYQSWYQTTLETADNPMLPHILSNLTFSIFKSTQSKECANIGISQEILMKISFFGLRNSPNRAHVGDDFQPYRSFVRSFPLLSALCPPSWTSKILANMCIIATGRFLGRIEPCIRHHSDDIFMYATLCWSHFDVSDMISVLCL